MTENLIAAVELTKRYRLGDCAVTAIRDVTLSVQRGEFVAIVGPSGSGKTTIMNLLGCLDRPSAGQYFVHGENVTGCSPAKLARIRNASFGFAFQNFNLLSRLTALENVELPLVYRGIPGNARKKRALDVLERLGLGNRRDHLPSRLSGGEQQRVALARAVVGVPLVLLADEPTGALDDGAIADILSIFERLNGEGMTIIMVTHDPDLAGRARRIVRVDGGQIVGDHPVLQRRRRSDEAGRRMAPPPTVDQP
jgi:putative ABC transport system ATP-binding protein